MKKPKMKHESSKKIQRSTAGLRNAIFDEIDLLRAGKITPARANAVARSVGSVVATVRLEMDYNSLLLSLNKINGKRITSVNLLTSEK